MNRNNEKFEEAIHNLQVLCILSKIDWAAVRRRQAAAAKHWRKIITSIPLSQYSDVAKKAGRVILLLRRQDVAQFGAIGVHSFSARR